MLNIKTKSNYLAKIVELPAPRPHPNADRLQVFVVDFENIITDLSYKEGDVVVVFPLECQINESLLSYLNCFRESELNRDKEAKGFFEKHRRVRAVKLRGEKSGGFCIRLENFSAWALENRLSLGNIVVGTEFDSIGDTLVCNKYEPTVKGSATKSKTQPKGFSRLVDGQFHLHEDTENLRRNMYKLNLEDTISITYKLHGTNAVFANVLTKVKKPWWKFWGETTVYSDVYSSRRVVKNKFKNGFYSTDLWGEMNDELKTKIPKGFSLYGEIVGYGSDGSWIQKGYDYGCNPKEKKFYLFRVTFTNVDGHVFELSWPQIEAFAAKYGFDTPKCFYYGTVLGYLKQFVLINWEANDLWREFLLRNLEEMYNEKDCYLSIGVPEEGIVVRKESLFDFEAYKLKSFRFLEYETKQNDTVS